MAQAPEVGRQIIFKAGHPHAGKRGLVVAWRLVDMWEDLGPRPVVQTEDGVLCYVTDLDKDWRYDLRVEGASLAVRR